MKTNITKLQELYGIQLNAARIIDELLSNYIPHGYSSVIVIRAKKNGRTTYSQWVRSVKSYIKKDLQILNLLIELAKEHKINVDAEKDKLNNLISQNYYND